MYIYTMEDKLVISYTEAVEKIGRQDTEFYFDQLSLETCIMSIKNKAVTDVDIHTVKEDDCEVVKVSMRLKDMKSNKITTFKQFKYSFVKAILKDYCEQHGINIYHN